MRVYETTVIDRAASREGEELVKYESYVVVGSPHEIANYKDYLPEDISDEDIHYYFEQDEWEKNLQADGTIENEEFTYWVGERVA